MSTIISYSQQESPHRSSRHAKHTRAQMCHVSNGNHPTALLGLRRLCFVAFIPPCTLSRDEAVSRQWGAASLAPPTLVPLLSSPWGGGVSYKSHGSTNSAQDALLSGCMQPFSGNLCSSLPLPTFHSFPFFPLLSFPSFPSLCSLRYATKKASRLNSPDNKFTPCKKSS